MLNGDTHLMIIKTYSSDIKQQSQRDVLTKNTADRIPFIVHTKRIPKLIVIAYEKKCLLHEINTVTKFLLLRMKYIIDRVIYLIIET